ncbi:MAG: hypothetical protein HQM00_12695 [Magnetococcales bacterium]|nr:hypothetical protein [Magnetococcales bacterium]
MFEWIVALLNHPATPWMLALSIPVWATTAWWMIRKNHLMPLRHQIHTALLLLDETPETPRAFPEAFATLESRMNTLTELSRSWRNFADTLIPIAPPQRIILHAQRPETFFRLDRLSERHPQALRLKSLPGQLVAIGLLFTFAGLIGALHWASRGLLSGDPEQTRLALQGVLTMASLKFLASLAGVMSAWIVLWRARVWHRHLEDALTVWCDRLSARLIFIPAERLAHELQEGHHTPPPEPPAVTATLPPQSLDPLIAVVREEHQKLLTLIQARLPDPATVALDLKGVSATIQSEGNRLIALLETHLNRPAPERLDPSAELPLQEGEMTHWSPPPVSIAESGSWQPLVAAMREEGEHLAQAVALHLAREMQTVQTRPGETVQLLGRTEQESWMRIIDRLEMAARALAHQSASLDGLSALAGETRRASEESIRAGRETVELLMGSVAQFNNRMEQTFARSADALLNRLAQNNQQIVSQVIAGLDREQAEAILIAPEPEKPELPQLYDQFLKTRSGQGSQRKRVHG